MGTTSEEETQQGSRSVIRPPTVLISADLHGRGGTETHLLNLCELLRDMGAEVTLVSRRVTCDKAMLEQLRSAGVRHITTPLASRTKLLRASQLWSYASVAVRLHRRFDLLYTYKIGRFTMFLRHFVRHGGQVVWHPFGDPRHFAEMATRFSTGVVGVAVAESRIHASALRGILPANTRVSVLPALAYTGAADRRRERERREEVRIAFLGRYDENKGAAWLVENWSSLDVGPVRLDFYGEGPLARQMEATRTSARLDNISINGGWDGAQELGKILGNVDLVVLPSLSEGVPLVLFECLAHGVPFVASDVGGIPELAQHNPDVRVAPRGEAFLRAVEEMVTAIRREEIDNNRLQKFFNDRYDPPRVARQWRSFMSMSN